MAYRHANEETRVLKSSLTLPEKATLRGGSPPAVSPDGRRLAVAINVAEQNGLWLRDLDSLAGRILPGTEGASFPFWSPDSRFLAFFASGKLKKIDVAGGPVLSLCDVARGVGGSWSKNDVVLFAPGFNSGLFRVSAGGGTATPVTALEPGSGTLAHRDPWFLPDRRHFLYAARNLDREKSRVYVADLDSKVQREIMAANSNVVYAAPGFLLFLRDGTLLAQPFEAAAARTTGDPVPVAERFFSSLKTAALSPYAFVAYMGLILEWVYVAIAQHRLKRMAEVIKEVPAEQRASLLAKEYNVLPKAGLSADQWIRSRKHSLFFFAFLAVLIAGVGPDLRVGEDGRTGYVGGQS